MKPALVLDVMIAHFAYGGNGGIQSEHPDIREWEVDLVQKLAKDPRIGRVVTKTISDTPITMTRNQAVLEARKAGCHLLMMVDSDQSPNKHAGESWFKPFWDEAFSAIYAHYGKGPLVVGAPYCGPPNGTENVYVFTWDNFGIRGDETAVTLRQYSRTEAALMTGVAEVAALPTGMILYDMRAFELIEPSSQSKEAILDQFREGKLRRHEALRLLAGGWFYYEWENSYAAAKASTEDVTNTRDISLAGQVKLGYNPIRCAWDSWVGHHKPWNVGKPQAYTVEQIAANFQRAVMENRSKHDRVAELKSDPDAERAMGWVEAGTAMPLESRLSVRRNGHSHIEKHHWAPWGDALEYAESLTVGKDLVAELGPGHIPFSKAQHFVGRVWTELPGTVHDIDLNQSPLPFPDYSVDFLYCRHTLEDLENPEHCLREIQRVAQSGFIETPSPIAECCRGVDAPGVKYSGRGYVHHRWILWSHEGVLYVLPKLPAINDAELDEHPLVALLNESPAYWNTYHTWEGDLQFRVLRHEIDFLAGENYSDILRKALAAGRRSSDAFMEMVAAAKV